VSPRAARTVPIKVKGPNAVGGSLCSSFSWVAEIHIPVPVTTRGVVQNPNALLRILSETTGGMVSVLLACVFFFRSRGGSSYTLVGIVGLDPSTGRLDGPNPFPLDWTRTFPFLPPPTFAVVRVACIFDHVLRSARWARLGRGVLLVSMGRPLDPQDEDRTRSWWDRNSWESWNGLDRWRTGQPPGWVLLGSSFCPPHPCATFFGGLWGYFCVSHRLGRGRPIQAQSLRSKLFYVLRCIFSIDDTCPETIFPARLGAFPCGQARGSVGVPSTSGRRVRLQTSVSSQ